jgi:hypothetical protein
MDPPYSTKSIVADQLAKRLDVRVPTTVLIDPEDDAFGSRGLVELPHARSVGRELVTASIPPAAIMSARIDRDAGEVAPDRGDVAGARATTPVSSAPRP